MGLDKKSLEINKKGVIIRKTNIKTNHPLSLLASKSIAFSALCYWLHIHCAHFVLSLGFLYVFGDTREFAGLFTPFYAPFSNKWP